MATKSRRQGTGNTGERGVDMTTVVCGNCRRPLDDDTGAMPEARKPCPDCGSTARRIVPAWWAGEELEPALSGRSMMMRASGTATLELISARVPPIRAVSDLLLQAVIVFGDKTAEGRLIEAVALPWLDIIASLQKDPSIAFQLPPDKWEEIIAGAYRRAGFEEVTLTPRSGDHGRDVIAIKKGLGSVRVIDQVKAYKPGHLVTANDVRALIGVLHGDGASKGFLTSTSDFAPLLRKDPLILPFIPSRLDLIDGKTDCLVIDYRMTGMDGLELVGHLRDRHVSSPVVLVTVYEGVAAKAAATGIRHVVMKPHIEESLVAHVRAALDEAGAT